ncbi:MAG: 16S rRNA (uracil(1498)-N(3))-methyltransferase [Armatimonadota bacterium]|nr:16S rRNA (uracil(1498)-N(3))-methyltransferase [bacterium]MDW8322064.1 16S rRNA (uracil(1498)-N(3))-methyltransferase [Armatimonadota bacterium]
MPKHRFFVPPERFCDGVVCIAGEDARQIRTVLRLQPGDEIGVLDGSGREYHCVLESVRKDESVARVHRWISLDVEPRVHITVVQSLAKGDKVERVIQHGTEIGVARFVLVQTERSVVRLHDDQVGKRLERWRRIAKEAAEQAHRAVVPVIEGVTSLHYALEMLNGASVLTLHPDNSAVPLVEWAQYDSFPMRVALIVGPEGGLTDEEVALCARHGAVAVSLMPRILRTETAALVAVSQILFSADLAGRNPTPP